MKVIIVVLALAAVVVHAILSHRFHNEQNEALLDASVDPVVSDGDFSQIEIEFDHLDGSVSGSVPSEQAREELLASLRESKRAGRIFDNLIVQDRLATLSVASVGDGVQVEGELGDLALHNQLKATVESMGMGAVTDSIQIDERIVEPGWGREVSAFAKDYFAKVKDGGFRLNDKDVVLRGKILGEEARDEMEKRIQAMVPEGANIVNELELLPDRPAELVAQVSGGTATLRGRVPSEEIKNTLAQGLLDGGAENIVNQLEVDPRVIEPAWSGKVAPFLGAFFSGKDQAEVRVDETSLTLRADIPASKGKDAILVAAREVQEGSGLSLTDQIHLVPDLASSVYASFEGDTLTLKGRVPSESLKVSLAKAAQASSGATKVDNELVVDAKVAPPVWEGAFAPFLGKFFGQGKKAEVQMEGANLLMKARLPASVGKGAILSAIDPLKAKGVRVVDQVEVIADLDPGLYGKVVDGVIVLEGQVPSKDMKDQIVTAATGLGKPVNVEGLNVNPAVKLPGWKAGGIPNFFGRLFKGRGVPEFALDPQRLVVKGRTASPEARDALLSAANGVLSEGGSLSTEGVMLDPHLPSSIRIQLRDQALELSGTVGSPQRKAALGAALAALDMGKVENQLKVNDQVKDPAWGERSDDFLKSFFGGADVADFEVVSKSMRLTRKVKSKAEKSKLLASANGILPAGATLIDEVKVLARPVSNLVVRRKAGGALELEGVVPDEALKAALGVALGEAFGDQGSVVNRITVNSEAKAPGWAAAGPAYLKEFFAGATEGTVRLEPESLLIARNVESEAQRDQLLAASRKILPKGATLKSDLNLVPSLPAGVKVVLKDGTAVLTGSVPDEAMKQSLGKSLAGLPVKVDNRLEVKPDIQVPAWKGKFAPFLPIYFEGVNAGTVEMGEKGLVVDVTYPTPEKRNAVLAEIPSMLPPGISVNSEGMRLAKPMAKPIELTLIRAEEKFQLKGKVPNVEMRSELESAVRSANPDVMIVNQIEVIEGLDDSKWIGNLPDVLGNYAKSVADPVFDLGADSLRMEGNVSSTAERTELASMASGKLDPALEVDIEGLKVRKMKPVRQPSLQIAVRKDGVTLSGEVGDEEAHRSLLSGAKKAAAGKKVNDGIVVSPEVHSVSWISAFGNLLPNFGKKVSDGDLSVKDGKVQIGGDAADPATRDSILAQLAVALPNDIKVEDQMVAKDRSEGADSAPTFTVYFRTGSTYISNQYAEEIQKAHKAIQDAGAGTTVLVKGYADSRGDADANRILSQRRAVGVRKKLQSFGSKADQMEMIAVGESEANAGKGDSVWSKDRKVEITVVKG